MDPHFVLLQCFLLHHFSFLFSPPPVSFIICKGNALSQCIQCKRDRKPVWRAEGEGHLPASKPICLQQLWLRWVFAGASVRWKQHQRGQFQATEQSFNHVSPTNVRRNYMAKSLQAVLNIHLWKLILQLSPGQRSRTAHWHKQQQPGRTEQDGWLKKHVPLCYFPPKDNGSSGTPYITVTPSSSEPAHRTYSSPAPL